jgi:nucleoid-associated protein YgaU
MNDPGIRIAVGLGIVVGGFFVANLFTPRPDAPPSPELQNTLRIRAQRSRPAVACETPAATPAKAPTPSPVTLKISETPPGPMVPANMASDASSRRETGDMPATPMPAPHKPAPPRRHTIVDGDTLGNLAQRYLGSDDRADEIFAANRDVLKDPELLPIGAVLTIPPRKSPSPDEESYLPPRRLVPIPSGWTEK